MRLGLLFSNGNDQFGGAGQRKVLNVFHLLLNLPRSLVVTLNVLQDAGIAGLNEGANDVWARFRILF